jgi:6-phosphogluconate dehydrogenase
MDLGIIGLGRMGGNMARRLVRHGQRIVAYDVDPAAVRQAQDGGAEGADSLAAFVEALKPPRVIWMMIPQGPAVDDMIAGLLPQLRPHDTLIDGGNSNYKDTLRRAAAVNATGVHYLDVGTSGGIWGLEGGYCLMVGGEERPVRRLEPLFRDLAAEGGYAHVGPNGAGHFVKMVHNAVEYGLMQAYAEGFELLKAKPEFDLDLLQVSQVWQHGSVLRSWLLEMVERALAADPELAGLRGYVEDTGEGRWAAAESVDLAIPTPVLTASLHARFRSRQDDPFGARLLAALRREFGGHAIKERGES